MSVVQMQIVIVPNYLTINIYHDNHTNIIVNKLNSKTNLKKKIEDNALTKKNMKKICRFGILWYGSFKDKS